MSEIIPLTVPTSTELQYEPAGVRKRPVPTVPASGSDSTRETSPPQNAPEVASTPQDEVKVQWDNPDQIVIYQFVNERGTLILQVPSEQEINLARQISQELSRDAQTHESAPGEGGADNGR